MAGMDWFRWHHGSVNDPKFQLVAKRSGATPAEVIAVWACLLEAASQAEMRGIAGEPDYEALELSLGLAEGLMPKIVEAMRARALLDGEQCHITSWEKRQPKRERPDDSSTERVKALRDRERHGTPSNASDSQETPRGEESREEPPSSLRSEGRPRKARVSSKLEITLPEYLELCKAEDRKPVPPDHPIRAYCEDAGITDEMRQVAWLVFKDRHIVVEGSKAKPKRYIDWAAAFANSVKDRWYGLWYVSEEGEATWSPDGLQQRRVLDSRMAKSRETEHAPA